MRPIPAVLIRIRFEGVYNEAQESAQDTNCQSEAQVFTDYGF